MLSHLKALLCLSLVAVCVADAEPAERTILPKPPPVSADLTVCDVTGAAPDDYLFYVSIQGIVNQVKPKLYLISDGSDKLWLDWILERGYVRNVTRIERGELLNRYRQDIKGAVVYDPELPATINLATMEAGISRLAIISPAMIETCGLPVKQDFRSRFKDNGEAYSWAIDNLMPHLNKYAMCSQFPFAHNVRDYLIQNRIFTFWVTGPNDANKVGRCENEREVIERAFRLTKQNAAITGFWYGGEDNKGINEYDGVIWGSKFGKPTVVDPLSTNNSIHAAIRVDPEAFRQKRQPLPELKKDKIYIAVSIIESGDAPFYWSTRQRTVWEDPNRGKVPISWCIGPATLDTRPDILEWYYRNAAPGDYFFVSLSGAGYIMPDYFAKNCADPEAAWDSFFELTDRYMKKLDLDMISLHMDSWAASPPHPAQYDDSPVFKRYAEHLPKLQALLPDFGRMEGIDLSRANHWVKGKDVSVFHCLTRWSFDTEDKDTQSPEWLANEVRKYTPEGKPAFMFVMALSWTYTPTDILKMKELLGDQYEFVNLRELDHLFRESQKESK